MNDYAERRYHAERSEAVVKEQSRESVEEILNNSNAKIHELQQYLDKGQEALNKMIQKINEATEKIQRGF